MDLQLALLGNELDLVQDGSSKTHVNYLKQVDFEKMSWHRIQWLLACNLLSNFVCTFKNVAEGYIHAKNANMGGAVPLL